MLVRSMRETVVLSLRCLVTADVASCDSAEVNDEILWKKIVVY